MSPSLLPIFSLRIPTEIRSWLEGEAAKNFRSLTSEIIIALRERMECEEAKRSRKK
jgi:hypothetical protein